MAGAGEWPGCIVKSPCLCPCHRIPAVRPIVEAAQERTDLGIQNGMRLQAQWDSRVRPEVTI